MSVERCLHVAVLAGLHHAFAFLRVESDLLHLHHGLALDHRRAAQQHVGGVGHLLVVHGAVCVLRGVGLAREVRFVHHEVVGLQHDAVGGYLVATLQFHDVAHHHVVLGHIEGLGLSVYLSDNLNLALVLHLVEHVKLLGGFHLKPEPHACGQQQRHQHPAGLDERTARRSLAAHLVGCHHHRETEHHQEHDDQWVLEFLQEPFP